MELLVATWTLRLAMFGSLAVAGISLSVGATAIEAAERAVIAAFALTFLGRQLISWLQTPEQRMLRLRVRREAARKGAKPGSKPKNTPKPVRESKRASSAEGAASPTS